MHPVGRPESATTTHGLVEGLRLSPWVLLCLFATPGWALGAVDFGTGSPQLLQSSDPETGVSNQFIDFGRAVDLDQDLLVVGAPGEDSGVTSDVDVGAVYVFERQGGSWARIQKLWAPTERASGEFGAAVGVARGTDGDGPIDFLFVAEPLFSAPKVHIYQRTPGNDFQFDSTHDGVASSRFGESLALDFFEPPTSPTGDPLFFAVIGASNRVDPEDSGNNQHGSAVIFQRTGGPPTWGPTHEFFGEPSQNLGTAVAMAGINVLAAAELDGLGVGDGGARWYTQGNFDGAEYNYAGDCDLLPAAQAAHVGEMSVATNWDETFTPAAAFGMPDDDDVAFNNGKVLVFDLSTCLGGFETPIETLQPGDTSAGVRFGASVAFDGPVLAVGAPGTLVSDSGQVYLYERGVDNSEWSSSGTLTLERISMVISSCTGAAATSLDGDHLVAGCPMGGNPQHEAAYVFTQPIFADGFESGDTSAWTVP